jgi:hypothetical protein
MPGLLGMVAGGALAIRLLAAANAFAAGEPSSEIATTFQASINAHDVEGAASLFADNAIVMQPRMGGLPQTYVGRDEIRWWLRNLAAQNVHLDVAASPRLTDSHLQWSNTLTLDAFRELGPEPLAVESDAVLSSDGRIESLQMTLTPDSARRLHLAPGLAAAQSGADGSPLARGLTADVVVLLTIGVVAGVLLSTHVPGRWRRRLPRSQAVAHTRAGGTQQTPSNLDGACG